MCCIGCKQPLYRAPDRAAVAGTEHQLLAGLLLRVALEQPDEASLDITFLPAGIMRLSGNGSLPWRLDRVNEVAPPLADSATVPP